MAKSVNYRELEGKSTGFFALVGALGALVAIGLGATYYMEHHGHYVTGMSNQIVWGMPHVFAIFLIVAASGALNVASIGSVFNKAMYKPLARLSGLLAITLLLGGLMILVLDLGRPDRLLVAMTTYNFKSIFAWNIFLYNGFLAIVAVYLWLMMEHKMNQYYPQAGFVAFVWRLLLTTGTGSIFGFLVARHAYDEAIMAPMFVIMSFSFGLAMFLLVLVAAYNWSGRSLGQAVLTRLKNLLGVFVASVMYFTLVYHATNLYITQHHDFERFILLDGGIYTLLFWGGHIFLGCLIPLFFIYSPKFGKTQSGVILASSFVILGAFAQLYVIIIGGQAFPLEIFPGYEVTASTFGDANAVHPYTPSLWEVLLGMGGLAMALLATVIGVRVLPFLPLSLADAEVDPHAKK
jgi:molybdopterin-containing oxidoreductase family membrane subunit